MGQISNIRVTLLLADTACIRVRITYILHHGCPTIAQQSIYPLRHHLLALLIPMFVNRVFTKAKIERYFAVYRYYKIKNNNDSK